MVMVTHMAEMVGVICCHYSTPTQASPIFSSPEHKVPKVTELQIRENTENNSKIICLISQQKHVVTPH